jgi:glyoxylase-like metal-dependent hydrolase (beta-lactamase superfamily II)
MAVREAPPWGTGLVEVAPDIYAYLQYDGSWGISNTGFLAGDDAVLVIDATLVPDMARNFIGEMRKVTDKPWRHLINTHSHPDHTGGNRLFEGAEIVAHTLCREEMARPAPTPPPGGGPPRGLGPIPMTEGIQRMFATIAGDTDRQIPLPTMTYGSQAGRTPGPVDVSEHMTLRYGDTEAQLLYYGPAHTFGDTMVYFPQHKLLFAGDVGFFYSTPLAGSGKIGGWLHVIDKVNELDVETIVPGHGPPGGKRELDDVREYFEFVRTHAREAYDAGLTAPQAVEKLDLGPYAAWLDAERIHANVAVLYREFAGEI